MVFDNQMSFYISSSFLLLKNNLLYEIFSSLRYARIQRNSYSYEFKLSSIDIQFNDNEDVI